MKRKKIYLAIPYSIVKKKSFKTANRVAHKLIEEGNIVFSPISHSHPIWIEGGKKLGEKIWLDQDREFVKWCDILYVIVLGKPYDGEKLIKHSKGVQLEIKWAKQYKKSIIYIDQDARHYKM